MGLCKLQKPKSVFKVRKVFAKRIKHRNRAVEYKNEYSLCSVFPSDEKMERAFKILFPDSGN